MKLTVEDARRIARLAALEIPKVEVRAGVFEEPTTPLMDPTELSALAHDLESILSYVDRLSLLELDGIPLTSHGVPLPTSLRDDDAVPSLSLDAAFQSAPLRVEDAFAVPKIIES